MCSLTICSLCRWGSRRVKKKIVIALAAIFIANCVFFAAVAAYVSVRYSAVDPQLRLMGFASNLLVRFDSEESLRALSSRMGDMPQHPEDDIVVQELAITAAEGHEIRVLVYKSVNTQPNATALLWLHGGGYAMKTPESEGDIISSFVRAANAVVIAPAYRLSVQAPYPAALNDCYDTLLWVSQNAQQLGVNEHQIFVGGTSAGGGLTAALSLYCRDIGGVPIAFQMPLYPMINSAAPTEQQLAQPMLVWDHARNEVAWQLYLQGTNRTQTPPYAAALQAEDYNNLPPTFTYVGTEDPFYADTLEYVRRLQQAGVAAEFHSFEGAYHGFDLVMPSADISQQALGMLMDAFVHATENYQTA